MVWPDLAYMYGRINQSYIGEAILYKATENILWCYCFVDSSLAHWVCMGVSQFGLQLG